jgi:zinc transporter
VELPAQNLLQQRASAPDQRGLIWGYRLGASAEPVCLDELPSDSCPIWLHFNLADARTRAWLEQQAALPRAALVILLEPHPRVRLELLPDALVGIIQDLHHGFKGDPEGFGDLRFYVDARRVITLRRHPLHTVDVLRRALQAEDAAHSTATWLERFLASLAASFGHVVHGVADQVDALEDDIVAGHGRERRATLAGIRRLLVRLRRHLNTNRTELGKLRHRHDHNGTPAAGLLRALDQLDGVAQDFDLVHERVRVLQEELAGLLAEATNRNLYVLSVVTTVLLPANLVTGIWGMNVAGLPWSDDAQGFFWVGLAVIGSIALSVALLRTTRVL